MISLKLLVDAYLTAWPDERERLTPLLELLKRAADSAQLINRANPLGHITASGFILARATGRVLRIYHPSLQRYLQPGGHIEPEDGSPLDAARREVAEETGLADLNYLPYHADSHIPIDIDIHRIPANPQRQQHAHNHHDFRYVFLVDGECQLSVSSNPSLPPPQWQALIPQSRESGLQGFAKKLLALSLTA